ncbi:MAG: Ig-like domain-containing protein, partial [Abditibacteriales bacterium]|nr:Ig-like domain-containing protein [Abditibacteriales bacterium]MDW8367306.1 Ig-like domain-containing protein [Abditibacteriales bacterium]
MHQKPFCFVIALCSGLAFLCGRAFAAPPKPAAQAKVTPPAASPRVLGISVAPKTVLLEGPRAQQTVIVTASLSDTSLRDVTREKSLTYRIADPKVAKVSSHGVVTPVSDGTTTLIIQYQNFQSQIPVKVKDAQANIPINFTTEVEPILSKTGCNMGACHGAQYGKGGFKLSLLAYDTDLDYRALTRQSEGRRVLRHDPTNSLILKKATMAVPHGGGLRFDVGSWEYNVIKQWIEQGVQPPTELDPEAVRLEVTPSERVLKGPGEEQQLIVRAVYSNGRSEDVTHKARFNSSEEGVATVTGGVGYSGGQRGGLVRAVGRGETVIMVRYMGAVGVARIYVPYVWPLPKMEKYPAVNFIDELCAQKWAKLGIKPSELSSDEEFL